MALGVDQAVAEILRDGDPARSIDGLAALFSFTMYDAAASAREIHIAEEPPDPDETVTVIIEGGGLPIAGALGQGLGRRPSFTVRTRAPKYETAQERAHAIHAILDEFEGLVHGIPFFRINANTEPIPLGRDREDRGGRSIWSQSFRSVTKRYTPT
jgi:hypothetical protein